MKKLRQFLKPALFFVTGLLFLLWTQTLLWIAFWIIAIFYVAVDVYSFGKRKAENESVVANYSGPYGVLGDYVVDATESYGLFMKLLNAPVFVDIRQDEFLERREQQAEYLFHSKTELETSLVIFMNANPEFRAKRVSYIGLHSKVMDQGEIFWDPNGHTLLSGTTFLDERVTKSQDRNKTVVEDKN